MWTQACPAGRCLAHWRATAGYRRRTAPNMAQRRFLQLSDVAEILNISAAQTYALVRNGDLPAVKIGGRGQWRVEQARLEEYIDKLYDQTRRFVEEHPLGRDEVMAGPGGAEPAGSAGSQQADRRDRDGQHLPD